jgi:hypothetical protein
MTVLTVPVRPAEDARLRPLPWRRMVWVSWRHHRIALAGAAAFLGALAVWLWIAGSSLHHAYAAAAACHPASSAACQNLIVAFQSTNVVLKGGFVLQPVPALIGAFVGGPMLARELETGTFRYAWTQAFGRRRWTLAKLVLVGVAVAAVAGAFSVLISWYYQPYLASGNGTVFSSPSPLSPGLFDLRGVAFAAWTLAAFAIGALAGMLIRRVVPAIAATLAVYAGLAFAVGAFGREHYMTPLLTTNLNVPGSAWTISQWWTKGGTTLSQSAMYQPINSTWQQLAPAVNSRSQKQQAYLTVLRYLTHHGYTYWTRYQPGSRFWPFQWVEGGWLLALSALLLAATLWLVGRRAT